MNASQYALAYEAIKTTPLHPSAAVAAATLSRKIGFTVTSRQLLRLRHDVSRHATIKNHIDDRIHRYADAPLIEVHAELNAELGCDLSLYRLAQMIGEATDHA